MRLITKSPAVVVAHRIGLVEISVGASAPTASSTMASG